MGNDTMVSRIVIIALLCSFLGGCWDNYNLEKEVPFKDVKVTWYWRSLGDNRRDFVEVSKGSEREVVLDCTATITDINVINDSIVIKTGWMPPNSVYESKGSGLGTPVRIDSTATEEELDKFINREFYEQQRKKGKIQFDSFNYGNLSGKISHVTVSQGAVRSVRFRLNDADETYLFIPLMTPINDYADFYRVAETGDSVYKPAFADTLILIKGVTKKMYKFTFRPPA